MVGVKPVVGNYGPHGPLSCRFSSIPNQTHLNNLHKNYRVGANLCRTVELKGQSCPPLVQTLQEDGPPEAGLDTPSLLHFFFFMRALI